MLLIPYLVDIGSKTLLPSSSAPSNRYHHPSLAESLHSIIEKYHSNATMSSNLENNGLVGLRNDDLNRDGLAMVVDDDNYEIMFEGKSYRSYKDYVQARRSRTAGIFADSGMLAARLAIAEEMTTPGPLRAKNPRDDLAIPPAKVVERDRKRAEKAEEEAQRAAKVVERDARWTPVVDAEIERMIDEGYSYDKIASKLGNGLKMHDIKNRWNRHLNKLSSIIKPAVQTGFPSSITWTADVDTTIVRMRADDISFAKIASELGNGLKENDIKNRWYHHLKQ